MDEENERPRDGRRLARETALRTLYEHDSVGHPAGEVLARRIEEDELPAPAAERARELVTGVVQHQPAIDARLTQAAPTWPLGQMPPIEKAILRVAVFEILFNNRRVPLKAAISEAVELAKAFGGDSSPRFVNGVLSTIAAEAVAGARPADEGESRSAPTEQRER